MPQKDRHLKQARKNEQFFSSFPLDSTPYLDWVVVGAFYAALHYIDAYLATKNVHPGEHREREFWVATERMLRRIEAEYSILHNNSRLARYECKQFSPEEVFSLIHTEFEAIQDQITKLVCDTGL